MAIDVVEIEVVAIDVVEIDVMLVFEKLHKNLFCCMELTESVFHVKMALKK